MLPSTYFQMDFAIVQGDDKLVPFIFAEEDGTPVDISGWDFFYTAKSSVSDDDTDALISVEPTDMIKSDSGTGVTDTVTVPISRVDTAAMTPGQYVHDLQVSKDGRIYTYGKGTLVIEEQVTQRTS